MLMADWRRFLRILRTRVFMESTAVRTDMSDSYKSACAIKAEPVGGGGGTFKGGMLRS